MSKLSKKEIEDAYRARIDSESRQPQTEKQKEVSAERIKKINDLAKKELREEGYVV